MNRRKADREPLRNGLTLDERVTLLESAIDGDRKRLGLVERVQDLEQSERRRALPFWMRWMVTFRLRRDVV